MEAKRGGPRSLRGGAVLYGWRLLSGGVSPIYLLPYLSLGDQLQLQPSFSVGTYLWLDHSVSVNMVDASNN